MRHTFLLETIDTLPMEDEAYNQAWISTWLFPLITLVLSGLQYLCFHFYNERYHPMARILEEYRTEGKLYAGYIYINYLVQLIEHPILRIPNILFVYILSIFPDRSFKLISKYAQKCQYNTLQHLKLGKLKFWICKIGCSMS